MTGEQRCFLGLLRDYVHQQPSRPPETAVETSSRARICECPLGKEA